MRQERICFNGQVTNNNEGYTVYLSDYLKTYTVLIFINQTVGDARKKMTVTIDIFHIPLNRNIKSEEKAVWVEVSIYSQ